MDASQEVTTAFLKNFSGENGTENKESALIKIPQLDKNLLGKLLERYISDGGDPDELLKSFFELIPNTDDGADKKLFVFRQVIKIIQRDGFVTSRMAGDMITLLQFQLDSLPVESLFELVELFIDKIKNSDITSEESIELLPKILEVIGSKNQVTTSEGKEESGIEFKSIVINRIVALKWRPQSTVRIVSLCKDLALSEDEEKRMIMKTCESLVDLDLKDLPAVVYQLLLLSGKRGHQRLVLDRLGKFFLSQFTCTPSSEDSDSMEIEVQNSTSSETKDAGMRHAQGTVLLHISTAMRHSRELSQEILKYLKSLSSTSQRRILQPFNLALALSLAKIPFHEDNIFKLLKDCVLGCFKDASITHQSEWLQELLSKDIEESCTSNAITIAKDDTSQQLEIAICSATSGWEHILEGLVKFSLILMEMAASKAAFLSSSNADVEHSPLIPASQNESVAKGKVKPEQLCGSVGGKMLVLLFNRHEEARFEIVEQLLNRIVIYAHTPSAAFVYTEALARVAIAAPFSLIESTNKQHIQECIEQLPSFAPALSKSVLSALMPVFKLSNSVRDYLLLVLRKCLFNRKSESRKAAVHGYLLLLRNFRCLGSSALSDSQLSQTYQFSQVSSVEARFSGPESSDGNLALCLELIHSLKRTFSHQADVRALVLEGLPMIITRNSQLQEAVLDLLLSQLSLYVDINALGDEFGGPPLLLTKCVQVLSNSTVVVLEPLGYLIRCCTGSIVASKSDNENDEEDEAFDQTSCADLKNLLDKVCKRLSKCELDDFDIDKHAELSHTTTAGLKNALSLSVLLGAVESLIEFKTIDTTPEDAQVMADLIKFHGKVQDFLREGLKGGKKEKDDDSQPGPSSGNVSKATNVLQANKTSSTLSLECVARLLSQICIENVAKNKDVNFANLLRVNHSLVRHLFLVAFQKMFQLSNKNYCEGASNLSQSLLFRCICDIVCAAWNHLLYPIPVPEVASQQQEKDEQKSIKKGGQPVKILLLETISTIISLVKEKLSSKKQEELIKEIHSTMINKIDDDEELNISFNGALYSLCKRLQKEISKTLRRKEKRDKWSEIGAYLTLIGQFHSSMNHNKDEYRKVFEWLVDFAKGEPIDDVSTVKILFTILLQSHENLDQKLIHVAQDARVHYGEIEGNTVDENEMEIAFQSISVKSAASVISLVLEKLSKILDEVNWLNGKLKAVVIEAKNECPQSQSGGAEESQDEALEQRMRNSRETVCSKLNYVQKVLAEMAYARLPFGSAILKDLLKLATKFYHSIASFSRIYLQMCQNKSVATANALIDKRFQALLLKTDRKLTTNIHPFIFHVEMLGTTEFKKKSEKKMQLRTALRDSFQIPALVYAIEQYDGVVLQLSKKSKLDLAVSTKNVARDFRITSDKVQEAMTTEEVEEEKENAEKGKRKAKTAKKMVKKRKGDEGSDVSSEVTGMLTSTQKEDSQRKISIGAGNDVSTINAHHENDNDSD